MEAIWYELIAPVHVRARETCIELILLTRSMRQSFWAGGAYSVYKQIRCCFKEPDSTSLC
jgi:hypothetical protein